MLAQGVVIFKYSSCEKTTLQYTKMDILCHLFILLMF